MRMRTLLPAYILIELISADIPNLLAEVNQTGIMLRNIERFAELTVRATVSIEELEVLRALR